MAPPNSRDNPSQIIRPRWTTDEDTELKKMVDKYDGVNWPLISESIPGRTEKSCRHRWLNNFAPKLKQEPFSDAEDAVIMKAHAKFGSQWARIAKELVGRTDSQIKNRWNSTLQHKSVALNKKGGSSSSQSETNPQPSKRIRGSGESPNLTLESFGGSNLQNPSYQTTQGPQLSSPTQFAPGVPKSFGNVNPPKFNQVSEVGASHTSTYGFQQMLHLLTLEEAKTSNDHNKNETDACGETCHYFGEDITASVLRQLVLNPMQQKINQKGEETDCD